MPCYAPHLAWENEGFPADFFDFLYKAEAQNFWFKTRNQAILHLFKKYVVPNAQVHEIGCGTGYVLKALEDKFPDYTLQGSEIHLSGIKFAQTRLPKIDFVQLDATHMPFNQVFDAVGAFDVLEHITDDEQVIAQVYKSLKPNGAFVINVPQYQWMWSITDDLAFHKRRYHRKDLKQKLEKAGFEVKYMGSFIFTLFPLMYLSRLFKRKKNNTIDKEQAHKLELGELKLPQFINAIFWGVTQLDVWLIKRGISLPFGGSLMVVAKKKADDKK
ncbi:hypothetical protein BKI52_44455 [marine bacterium AO1-C]|nr:hypothetical protein BKI52_44455 [marine bacterium AO1-C]